MIILNNFNNNKNQKSQAVAQGNSPNVKSFSCTIR